jgi:capsular exopolysaccharide synthesis family protein
LELQTQNIKTVNSQDDALADLKKFLFFVLKYWYAVVACLVLALGAAYLVNKYSHRVYPVSMALYIKEDPGMESSAAILYANNPLLKGNPNYYNEPYLIKADPVMQEVVEKLGFHLTFFKEGRVKTTEIYPKPEVNIRPAEGSELPYGQTFAFEIIDGKHFYLAPERGEEGVSFTEADKFDFGVAVQLGSSSIVIDKLPGLSTSQFINNQLSLHIQHPASVGRSYANSVKTSWTAEGASLLDLTVYGTSPQKEIDFLNTLASTYIAKNTRNKTENASRTIDFIDEQLRQISDSLSRIEGTLETFKRNNLGVNLGSEASGLLERLNGLEVERGQYRIQQQYYDYIQEYIRKDQHGEPVVPSTVGINDGVLNTLVSQLVSLQMERNNVKQASSVENPFLEGITNRITDVKENITEYVQNLRANLAINQKEINGRIQRLEREMAALPKAEREYVNIKRMYDLSEGLYLFLMQKKAEAGITKASTTASIRIVNPAKLVGGSISPNVNKNYVVALAGGLGLPIGILFLFFYFNDRIRYKDEVTALSNIPFLGTIGHNASKLNLIVAEKPRSAVAESFRSIRSNLQFFTRNEDKGCKTYLLTSSVSGEGKTFCSANLAMVYAFSGKKTLILGGDLRKPRVFEGFNKNNDIGLSNYLIGQARLEDVIQETSISNLFLITGGLIPPNPSELLMSEQMKDLMQSLKEQFDIIILDSPPIGLVTDAMVLLPFADHTIFLVRQNYTTTASIKALQEMYEGGKINNISILYNDQKVSRYGYGYGYGYGHGKGNYYVD